METKKSLDLVIKSLEKLSKSEDERNELYLFILHNLDQFFEVSERMSLTIPQTLRDFAQLNVKQQTALVGMGSKFELWNLDNWEKKQSGMQIAGENLIENLPPSLEEIPF